MQDYAITFEIGSQTDDSAQNVSSSLSAIEQTNNIEDSEVKVVYSSGEEAESKIADANSQIQEVAENNFAINLKEFIANLLSGILGLFKNNHA
jgi:hypothetical protein